ncbi:PAS domain-containing protein [Sphingomonas phyllosphaerae]|uniref:PAS domain-containing protein n=1 Tax=Sphingomonas phyllosphaerae TaxID=257003 RepID=UPI0009DC1575|nr:PAS domain-containing protein [Sphingomonas phyllosphaerae]
MSTLHDRSELLTILYSDEGVALWDAVLYNSDPNHARSRWRWSSEFRRLLGFETVEEFPDVFSSWVDALYPEDAEGTFRAVGVAVKSAAPVARYDVKYRLQNKDGQYRWYRAIGVVTHDVNGAAVRACGTLIDIDEAEKVLADQSRAKAIEQTRLSEIEKQLRLISINAQIEAARMGGAGAAFAVVAKEITSLAAAIGKSIVDV